MAKVPVLNDNQFERLKNVLGERKVIDLTDKPSAHSSRLPTMLPEEKTDVVADGTIIIKVRNSTSTAFAAGQAVAINYLATMTNGVYQAKAISNDDLPFGVCCVQIPAGETGDCIISGIAEVTISTGTGRFAKPVSGGNFQRGNEGVQILNVSGGTKAFILLGDYYKESTPIPPPSTDGVPPGTVIAYAGPLDYRPGEFYDDQYFPEGYSGYGNVPDGWLHCHGQAVSRTVYAALFAAIGTVYGAGDGSTTFNVPDFRGTFLRGTSAPNPVAVNAHIVLEEEEGEPPTDYGYIDATGLDIEGGTFSYYDDESGEEETIVIEGTAILTPTGLVVNNTLYQYSNMSDITGVYVEGCTATSFSSVSVTDGGENQSEMGKQFREEMPNFKGQFMALSQDKYYPKEKYSGTFTVKNMDGRTLITEFKMPQYSQYPSYLTIKGVDADGNYSKTFNNCEIYWNPDQEFVPPEGESGSGTVEDDPYADKFPALLVSNFSMFMGQRIMGYGNATTVNDYYKKYGSYPPENSLTIKNDTTTGHFLPERSLVHWLIKY